MVGRFLSDLCHLENKEVILASESPRRKILLETAGLKVKIVPANLEEFNHEYSSPTDYVLANSRDKARMAATRLPYDLIISADTIVLLGGRIYEKPINRDEARWMLQELSGKTHQVITGFCLLTHNQEILDFDETKVTFYSLSFDEIETYLDSGEPFDKAGAYGIQGPASLFVRKIEGCYFNVVGFPLGKFYQRLKQIYF
jgi:septum formation protein